MQEPNTDGCNSSSYSLGCHKLKIILLFMLCEEDIDEYIINSRSKEVKAPHLTQTVKVEPLDFDKLYVCVMPYLKGSPKAFPVRGLCWFEIHSLLCTSVLA